MLDHPPIAHHLIHALLKLQCLAFQKAAAVCQNILDMAQADPVETLQTHMNYIRWRKKEIVLKNSKNKRLKDLK
jgi:hypothetical protein